MKPYYSEGGITLYHGDCRAIAPSLEYDAVVSDPPYGMAENTNRNRFSGPRVGGGKRWDAPIHDDDKPFDPSPWIDRPSILWGCNHYAARLPVGSTLVWIKRNDGAFGSFLSDAELAWRRGGHGVYCYRRVWTGAAGEDADGVHPCQKPVDLMRWCVGMVDGVILDPFMGSGTTLVAAKMEGREAVGIEIEERYCEIAANRLSQGVLDFGGSDA